MTLNFSAVLLNGEGIQDAGHCCFDSNSFVTYSVTLPRQITDLPVGSENGVDT